MRYKRTEVCQVCFFHDLCRSTSTLYDNDVGLCSVKECLPNMFA